MNKAVFSSLALLGIVLAGCTTHKIGSAYWQRVESDSALYMKGPKAQQILEENIATCVREIDELVKLEALRRTTPPDTHSEYNHALKASGDLDFYDTPTRQGDLKVAHSNFHDFESCMREKGWERVRYLRYQEDMRSKDTYKKLKYYRETGKMINPTDLERQQQQEMQYDYFSTNE